MVDKHINLSAVLSAVFLLGLILPSHAQQMDDDVIEGTASTIVSMSHSAFEPAELTISVGETVRFQNTANMPDGHTVMADDGSFVSPPLAEGESWEHTFDAPGTYVFHNHQHRNVKGSITVVD